MCCLYFLDAGAFPAPVLLFVGSGVFAFFSGVLVFFLGSTILLFQLLLNVYLIIGADRDDNRMHKGIPVFEGYPGGGDVPPVLSPRLPFGRGR